ncbi:MAG: alpha/beta hydrolase, partial [Gammaproteobacteria bacterium]
MYYQTHGDSYKPALVLLHSGGMAGVEWQPQIQPLVKSFRLLVPDLPGHGQSLLPPKQTLSISLMAKAVVRMLAAENCDKAHIVGSSMGGAVALWVALKYPQVVDKLV